MTNVSGASPILNKMPTNTPDHLLLKEPPEEVSTKAAAAAVEPPWEVTLEQPKVEMSPPSPHALARAQASPCPLQAFVKKLYLGLAGTIFSSFLHRLTLFCSNLSSTM